MKTSCLLTPTPHEVLADECCDAGTVSAVREASYDVRSVAEDFAGESDDVVHRRARVEDRVLLTEDKDFGTLVYRLQKRIPGLILLRFPESEKKLEIPRILKTVEKRGESLRSAFTVIDPEKTRHRPLKKM